MFKQKGTKTKQKSGASKKSHVSIREVTDQFESAINVNESNSEMEVKKEIDSKMEPSSIIQSDMNQELETAKKRLMEIDLECQIKVHEQVKNLENGEIGLATDIWQQNVIELEEQIQKIMKEYQTKLKESMEKFVKSSDEKDDSFDKSALLSKEKFELEIKKIENDAKDDIEKYHKKRENDLEASKKIYEQFQAQCLQDVEEYSTNRNAIANLLIERLKDNLQIETNAKQVIKEQNENMEQMKQQIVSTQLEELNKMNSIVSEAIKQFGTTKSTLPKKLDEIRQQVEEKYREERDRLHSILTQAVGKLKGRLGALEQREVERRLKTKQELLNMLAMNDTIVLTDEEFITNRYEYTIERNRITKQSNCSSIYQARKKDDSSCLCKVTMFHKWSVRHRLDYMKHSTRLMRYLAANHEKAPMFVKVIEVFATDTKLYTFMEPLSSSNTLESQLNVQTRRKSVRPSSSSSADMVSSNLKKSDIINIVNQVVAGIRFLSNLFIAHANLSLDNITLLADPTSVNLSKCQLVITGLTRAIVYYNVESDDLIMVKGYEVTDVSPDHLPPECFDASFQPMNLDLYSIGILLYRLIRIRSPFINCGKNVNKISAKRSGPVNLVLNSKERNEHGNELVQLVASLTNTKWDKRISLENISVHEYFS
ncbi:hypothetical protein RDWZM_005440 [Blomia tropicalis]|uniref:Protein kinase domain-containing protein n=1 Tax=Blomia tropicalis TaxID=40697 RepID=A0A9Q0M6S9_BLOTA|nr:hypothetical protein RDWZM_005440 [Blomia tropicalis]